MKFFPWLCFASLPMLSSHLGFAGSCPPATFQEISQTLKGAGETKLVFFASWCSSCKQHMENPDPEHTVFVAVFDEQARAEHILKSYSVKSRCFYSDDTAKFFDVRSLPAVKSHIF